MSTYSELYPDFADKVEAIVAEMNRWCDKKWPGRKAKMSEGYRTTARQQELYAQGRTKPGSIVTQKNGTTNPSNHQSRLAADLVGVTPEGKLTWDCPEAFWAYLGHLARKYGLDWGGDWKSFPDRPHVEWRTSDRAMYTKAKAWKP
ncbi:M15 family peptidase [bacterium]|nr:MAG: M15 family peptidase [bacterium]